MERELMSHNRGIHIRSLMKGDIFIDTFKLSEGIYATNQPAVYFPDQIKESLEPLIALVRGEDSTYLENFKKCGIVDVAVIPL